MNKESAAKINNSAQNQFILSKILKLNFTNITICKQFPHSHKVNEGKISPGQRDNLNDGELP